MRRKFKISFDAKASVGGIFNIGVEGIKMNLFDVGTEYERKVLEFEAVLYGSFDFYNMSGVSQHLYIKDFMIDIVDELDGIPTPYEPYTGETITVTNETESPAFGLKSHKGITNIISPGNVKCVYPTSDSGAAILDTSEKSVKDARKDTTVNLLKPTLKTSTFNGITCTDNGDGTYTFNGTATEESETECRFDVQKINDIAEKNIHNDLWLVGCPKNGGTNRYRLQFWSKEQGIISDTGAGVKINMESTIGYIGIAVVFYAGVTVNNLVFKPMLTTNFNATYDDFVPYTGDSGSLNWDVVELNDRKADKSETTVNLLKPTLQTTTSNGVTCTNNGDGTYTLNGTATKDIVLYIAGSPTKNTVGGYKLLGCPTNGSKDTYRIVASYYENGEWRAEGSDIGNGIIIDGTYSRINYLIKVVSGTTITNLVFKPMITTNLNATYDDFVPYTGDGDTLASDVAEIKNDLGGLTFSASGTTLTITDGTNTWTLGANS